MNMEITRKAYAKLNFGLDVIGKRDDGYHLVRMIMQNIDLYDSLNFKDNTTGEIKLESTAAHIPTDDSNLIVKVAKQLKEEYDLDRGADIFLEKRIPAAAGMAGGSTDGAAAYHALNELWGLGLSEKELCGLGVKLGADIPYCIVGGTALAEGIGEKLTVLQDCPKCALVIAKPAIDVSTGWVYRELDSNEIKDHPDIDGIRKAMEMGDIVRMCDLIGNVLEPVTTSRYGVINEIEEVLEENGAIKAFMTGSGPTVFGIFEDMEKAKGGFEAVKVSGLAPELFLSEPINPNR